MRFTGLALQDAVPDAETIWLHREQLTRAGALAKLFARFDAMLADLTMSQQRWPYTAFEQGCRATDGKDGRVAGRSAGRLHEIPAGWRKLSLMGQRVGRCVPLAPKTGSKQ